MITKSKQSWELGSKVNIGFLKGFEVIATRAVKDYMPDIYLLQRNSCYYEFIPHNGLTKLSQREVDGWINELFGRMARV